MNELIQIDNFQFVKQEGDAYISGVEICRRLGYARPDIQASNIWNRHYSDLEENSVLTKMISTDGKYYKTRVYNEEGALFFITKCNTKLSNQITKAMIKAFLKLRDILNDPRDAQWHLQRIYNKNGRRSLTDTMKAFVELAKEQGCSKPDFYYMNFTKLVQKGLFTVTSLKKIKKNLRDHIDEAQLSYLTATEYFLKNELSSMIDDGEYYKTIYQIAKVKVNRLIELLGSSFPALLTENDIKLLEGK